MPTPIIQSCDDLEIPHRLRRKDKKVIPHFENGELLFRWFYPNTVTFEGKVSPSAVKQAFQPPHELSVNRSNFCENSTDVLYNPFRLPHRFDHGVLETNVEKINGYKFESINNSVIKFELDHAPENCMYPHSNILVFRDGNKIEKKINSKILKADIRDELRVFFKVCHYPDEELQLELEK